MDLDTLLARLEADRARHLIAGPATPQEIAQLEQSLGCALPAALRALLTRVGWGLLYDRHELFGPRPLIIHDIELVPSLLVARRALAGPGGPRCGEALPFHRTGGVVHAIDLADGRVLRADGGPGFPDLARFLEELVFGPGGKG